MDEVYPGNELLKNLFKDCKNDLVKSASVKLLDANRMKSNLSDPHKRTTSIPNIHRLVFSGAFGCKFLPKERLLDVDLKRSSPIFKLFTLDRLNQVFGPCFVKCHPSKDTSFISPVSIFIGAQQDDNPWLQQENLVMPLRQLDNNRVVECFIPCGGIDPDTDEIPTWSEEISLKDIVPDLDKKCIYPLRLAGVGKITGYRDFNFAIVQPNQVKKDDYVISRGQWMQVVTSGKMHSTLVEIT